MEGFALFLVFLLFISAVILFLTVTELLGGALFFSVNAIYSFLIRNQYFVYFVCYLYIYLKNFVTGFCLPMQDKK